MKIDSMDASNITFSKPAEVKNNTKDKTNIQNTVSIIESKIVSQITDIEKLELPLPDKIVISAIEKANKAISGANKKFEFSIHQQTKEIIVKVIDSDTGEIIREIPPEKVLDMVAKFWEMAGIIVDERR